MSNETRRFPHAAPRIQLTLLVSVFCAGTMLAACVSEDDVPPTTVILVRHAEKMAESVDSIAGMLSSEDPALSEIGRERARALARVLGEAGVDAIYATQYVRTKSTAQPLADLLGLDVIEATAGRGEYAAEMAEAIRAEHIGEVVLDVGHSNTVPDLIQALGAGPVPEINENEYDGLYVVTIDEDGNAALLPLRYGSETP
jgi:phosphohistidine phosphatase SixA